MMEAKMKLAPLCNMCETLEKWCEGEVNKGKETVDTKELGEAIDMVKDIKCAIRDYWQAKFYELMCDQLEEEREQERMGYTNNSRGNMPRYPRMGYMPVDPMMAEWDTMTGKNRREAMDGRWGDPNVWDNQNGRMGYRGQPRNSYGEYTSARRHYTETGSPEAKEEMNRHAMNHLHEVESSVNDIWQDADPEMKKRMKGDLMKLVEGLKV